jgi:hypothetical protein
MNYLEWNDQIASHFFRPEMAGRRVHLYVNEDLIAELGHSTSGLDDFIEAVKAGPPWATRQGICQKALQSMQEWRKRGRNFPTYICYLSLFVIAAGKEGDFAPHAYYPRLRTLLGEEPRAGQYPSFDRMVRLWDDLERWSNKDRAGELGLFYNSIAGNWFHVGIPIAQTLLTEHERRALPQIFALGAMDPSAPPSDEELALLVRRFGQNELRPRTLSLLGRRVVGEDEVRGVLIETIVEELHDWDGIVTIEQSQSGSRSQLNGILRLCCYLDEIAGIANFTLRCSSRHDLPADGLLLTCQSNTTRFSCEEYGLGWSTPLKKEPGGDSLNASSLNWSDALVMQDHDQGWLLRFSPAPVRVFVSGESQGIHGLVEVRRLPQSTRFYLAVQATSQEAIKKWGEASCKAFKELQVSQGLPKGWSFFRADAALGDKEVRHKYPMLALPATIRLFFRGGIRVSQGNQFFRFAQPYIVLEGNSDSIEVYCAGIALEYDRDEGCYKLPRSLPSGEQLTVEVRRGSEAIKKLSFYLEEEFPVFTAGGLKKFDRFGFTITGEDGVSGSIVGTVVNGIISPLFDFNCCLQHGDNEPVFYLGRGPGQVINYPSEPWPTDWSPVWAITIRRTGKAEYCGTSLSNSDPATKVGEVDRKKLQLWKDLLWHRRKRITGPGTPNLRNLWLKYQEAARYV